VSEAKRKAWLAGRRGETLAAWYLRLKGYRILERDLRTPVGEIDLVIGRGAIIAFVEVKTRPTIEEALAALAPRQQARIRRAAEWYLAAHPAAQARALRFDALAVAPWRIPRHIIDAWRAD